MENKNIKIVESLEELNNNWKNCFIVGCPNAKTKKTLIEGFNLGFKVRREVLN